MARTRRRLGLAIAAALALTAGGCEWSLSFETNGSSLAERIMKLLGSGIVGNSIVSNRGIGPPGGGGSDAGSPGDAADEPTPEAIEPEPVGPAVSMTLAGRPWRVVAARAAAASGTGPVVVEVVAEAAGVWAAARALVPADQWPRDEAGGIAEFEWRDAAADPTSAAQAPSLPLDWPKEQAGLEIIGGRYAVEVAGSAIKAAVTEIEGVTPVRGHLDLAAKREGDADAARQLLRLRFARPAAIASR